MNRIEETWKVLKQIATLGLYSNDFAFFKRTKKKRPAVYHLTPDAIDLRVKGNNRKQQVSVRCPN